MRVCVFGLFVRFMPVSVLFVCLFVCLFACLLVCLCLLPVCLCVFICLFVRLFFCLLECLFTYVRVVAAMAFNSSLSVGAD